LVGTIHPAWPLFCLIVQSKRVSVANEQLQVGLTTTHGRLIAAVEALLGRTVGSATVNRRTLKLDARWAH